MSVNIDATNGNRLDIVKWLIVGLLLSGGMFGFYYFTDTFLLLRVIILLIFSGLAAWIAIQTTKGKETIHFLREAHIEVRKVVWPTRQETIQTTMVVIIMVFILAILVWIVDGILFWIVKLLTG